MNGSGFTAESTVTLDGKTRPTAFVSTFQLAADLAAADLAATGNRTVAVQDKDGAGGAGSARLAVVATLPTSTAPTLTVDLADAYRDVTRVASGSLYGLTEDGVNTSTGLFATPQALLDPLKPRMFRQPAPNHHHLPNGEQVVVSDALKVAGKAARAGATVTILMPEMYVDFPYPWSGWTDWNRMTDEIVSARLASGATNIYGYELWNEPNWTFDGKGWGSFADFWRGTAQRIRSKDSGAKLIGPSIDMWDAAWMRDFLTSARASGVLPDVVVWHELGKPEGNVYDTPAPWFIADHVAEYRNIESSLGIGPLPISINEFAVQREEGVPGSNLRYFAQFERAGVDTACAAFWFRPGRLSNILTDKGQANGGWWLYRWYGDLSGRMAMATSSRPRQLSLDGIASVDPAQRTARVIFGGTDGDAVVSIRGLDGAGFVSGQVHVKAEATPWYGVDTAVAAPVALFEGDFRVAGNRLILPFHDLDSAWGYHLLLTAGGAARTRLEAEAATLTNATAVDHSAASSDGHVAQMSAAGSAVRFTVETPSAGTYALQIAYANGTGAEARQALAVNGSAAAEVVYPSTSGWFAQGKSGRVRVTATLRAGTNTIELAKGSAGSVELDAIDLIPATFRARAEAEHARLSGGARTFTSGYASGDGYVGYIENASYVEFTVDGVPSAGSYTLEVGYFNGNGASASQSVSVNGGSSTLMTVPSTGGWGGDCPNFGTRRITTVPVTLRQGSNTVRFTASGANVELDYVEVR